MPVLKARIKNEHQGSSLADSGALSSKLKVIGTLQSIEESRVKMNDPVVKNLEFLFTRQTQKIR